MQNIWVFSPLILSKRQKNVLLSWYIFLGKQKLGCNAKSSKINNRFDTWHHGVKVNVKFLLFDICKLRLLNILPDGIFETGAPGVPSRSQSPNVLGFVIYLGLRMLQFQKYHP